MSCAEKLRARIDRFLPAQLQEAVVVPDDLQCGRKMVVVNGPSGAGKTEYVRAHYPRYVSTSGDNLQYTGPCRQRLYESRAHGADEDVFETCEELGAAVSKVVQRESIKVGANLAFETTAGGSRPPSYELEYVLVFRPFREAYANMMSRHHDMTKTSVPWATDFSDVRDYLVRNFVPHMQKATFMAATTSMPVRVVNTANNAARTSTLKAAMDELTRAMVFVQEQGQRTGHRAESGSTRRRKK